MSCLKQGMQVRYGKKAAATRRPAAIPASPDKAVLDRVRNPQPIRIMSRRFYIPRISR